MIFATGMGWINKEGYGSVAKGIRGKMAGGLDSVRRNPEVFGHPFNNFARLDEVSKTASAAVSLALKDADVEHRPGKKLNIGIIGSNASGSLSSDIAYFTDYVESGKKTSRGNLFIYTLPTSPLAEAAIHFGLAGPLLYVTGTGNPFLHALSASASVFRNSALKAVLASFYEGQEALCLVISKAGLRGRNVLCSLAEAEEIAGKSDSVKEMAKGFSDIFKRKPPA